MNQQDIHRDVQCNKHLLYCRAVFSPFISLLLSSAAILSIFCSIKLHPTQGGRHGYGAHAILQHPFPCNNYMHLLYCRAVSSLFSNLLLSSATIWSSLCSSALHPTQGVDACTECVIQRYYSTYLTRTFYTAELYPPCSAAFQ